MQKKITQALLDHIKTHSFDYGDNPAESVLDFLWLAYFDIQRGDPEDIKQGFRDGDRSYLRHHMMLKARHRIANRFVGFIAHNKSPNTVL